MKKCPYCGAEYPDDAVMCTVDHTPFESPSTGTAQYRFRPLSPEDSQRDFVTLVSCFNLPAADVILGRLQAAGIEAFISDASATEVMSGINAFGFVRIEIAPKDYEAAKELLNDIYGAK